MNIQLVPLDKSHSNDVIAIFNYYIENSTAAFRDQPVGSEHFDSFAGGDSIIKSYAATTDNGIVAGFCTLEAFAGPRTFRHTAELLYFIKRGYTGAGIGSKMLEKLEYEANAAGIGLLTATIADDNMTSIEFHKQHGFSEYGHLCGCWEKFNRKLGIIYMQKKIQQVPI